MRRKFYGIFIDGYAIIIWVKIAMMNYIKNNWRQIGRDLLIMIAALSGAAILCVLLRSMDQGDIYVSMIFLLAVAVVARFTNGPVYGIVASVIGVVGVNYAFTAPYFEFCLSIPGYLLSFASMLAVSVTTSALISQIKQQEKQRYRAQVEEMRANLLRAVSHDLRTPLTSISGAASFLIEHPEMQKAQQEKLLKDIADDSQWLVRMVENLLSITRINTSRPASLHKELEAAEEVLAESVRKFRKRFINPPVEIRLPDELVMVPMDPLLIEQVLTNLLENVVYHAQATRIRMNLKNEGSHVVFEVIDNGIGIPQKQIPEIFDANVSGGSMPDGNRSMGIGLSVCKAIILAHGGKIEAENQSEGGACFRFCLPMKEEYNESSYDRSDR